MTVDREITSARVKVRWLDTRDVIRLADSRNVLRHVGPGCTTIATDLDVSIVSTHPKYSRHFGRLSYSHDVTVTGITVVFRGHRIFAGHAHDRQCVAIDLFCEIGGGGPGVAAVQ